MKTFAAIDFETANHSRDSACAIGVVVVSRGRVAHRFSQLIRPPTREFCFTHIHGLAWNDVSRAPTFADLWPQLRQFIAGVDFLAAHNAPFDRGVLDACCRTHRVAAVPQPFTCTVRVAREVWGIYPTKLSDVCRHLGIPLRHHEAASDAEACARIILAAEAAGWRPR